MRTQLAVALAMVFAGVPTAGAQQPSAAEPQTISPSSPFLLTLEAAIARALEVAPRTAAAAARLHAAAGAVDQADVLPNPEVSVEFENFRGSGPYRGYGNVETTYSLSQTIELGGKRGARTDAARAARSTAGLDLAAARLDLIRDVRQAFADAVAADATVALAEEQSRLAGEVERSTLARLEAGREAPIQLGRAEIARRQAQLRLEQARRRVSAARQVLAGLTGITQADVRLEDSWFRRVDDPATRTEAKPTEVLRRESEVRRSRAELEVERSKAIPDVTLSGGFRRFREGRDNAFLVGISVPIPLFDQNRGAIRKARAELVAAEADLAAERIDQERRVIAAHAILEEARDTAMVLQAKIIPIAEKGFSAAQEGYRQGKFSYLEMLEAQRTLFDARREMIETLQGYHNAQAELERLTATAAALDEVTP